MLFLALTITMVGLLIFVAFIYFDIGKRGADFSFKRDYYLLVTSLHLRVACTMVSSIKAGILIYIISNMRC